MLIADARRLRSSFSIFRVRRPQHTAKEKYTSGHTTKSMIAAVSAVLSNFFQLSGS